MEGALSTIRSGRGSSKAAVASQEGESGRRFPNRIRPLRLERGWTQGQLARLMGYESVSSLASLEAGKKRPSMDTLIKLEAAFQRGFRDLYPRYFDAVYDPVARRRSAFFRERSSSVSAGCRG